MNSSAGSAGGAGDHAFVQSAMNILWPNTAAAAGSFWNFQPPSSMAMVDVEAAYEAHAARLRERGVVACPAGCVCNVTSSCGILYMEDTGLYV